MNNQESEWTLHRLFFMMRTSSLKELMPRLEHQDEIVSEFRHKDGASRCCRFKSRGNDRVFLSLEEELHDET
ncbi:uncharacterized protein V6R79_000010 [Siganus canaliculatus]